VVARAVAFFCDHFYLQSVRDYDTRRLLTIRMSGPPIAPKTAQFDIPKISWALAGAFACLAVIVVAEKALKRLKKYLEEGEPEEAAVQVTGSRSAAIIARLSKNLGVQPSSKLLDDLGAYERQLLSEITWNPDVSFDDIGGLGGAIDLLKQHVFHPLAHPELFSHSAALRW
jgi:hypothetical protein